MKCMPLTAAIAMLTVAPVALAQGAKPIKADGSGAVAPLTSSVVAEFKKSKPDARVTVGLSGTSGGFRRFVVGETDLSNASRAIRKDELEKAKTNKVEYLESLVAFSALTICVAKDTKIFGKEKPVLTIGELELLWSREAEDVVTNWSHLGSRFADAKIALSGAPTTSGTFDFIADVVNRRAGDSRSDYVADEDEDLLAVQTGKDAFALTYFAYYFLQRNQEHVQPVAIDPRRTTIDAPAAILAKINAKRAANGKKPLENGNQPLAGVLPDVDTIGSYTYHPFARPLFVYVNRAAADRPEVQALMEFYLDEKCIGNREFLLVNGYVPVNKRLREASRAVLAGKITGSAFGGDLVNLTPAGITEKYLAHAKLAPVEPEKTNGRKDR
jgi:phosphate transport system substrate-binding protein